MNPAALKANLGDLPAGGTIIVDTHDFTDRALARVGWKANPLDDGTLDRFIVHSVDLTQLTLDALADTELSRKDAGRSKNMFALGLLSWMYSRPVEGTLEFLRQKFANKPNDRRGEHHRIQGGLELRRDDRGVRGHLRGQARSSMATGTYRNISGNAALAYGLIAAAQRAELPLFLGAYPITPGIGHPARAVQAQALRRADVPGRGRDRRHRRRHRGVVRRSARGHDVVGPGHRAQGRGDRAGRVAGDPAGHLRHPARRAVHRPADQDRAIRPAAGDVRTQRRGAGADRRAAVAGRLLRRDHRGGPHRSDLSHSGVLPLRRLPGQWLRAVAGADRRRTARPARRVRHRAQRTRR